MYPIPRKSMPGITVFVLHWMCSIASLATEPQLDTAEVDFVSQIQPLFRKHCYKCHGRDLQEGGLRLDRKQNALRGGDNGTVILSGRAIDSPLMQLLSADDPDGRIMPPADEGPQLTAGDLVLIRRWIDAGAVWPDGVDPIDGIKRDLWSFEPVLRPAIPTVSNVAWVRNPIDAFVLARLEGTHVEPAPSADATSLSRRVAFDLTGLPLTLKQLHEFQVQNQADPEAAYVALLKKLLASQHYGERWARHWLDVVRYADSNGYEVDGDKPLAWQYRDYVIRSLNEDKAYDRFVLEQLAGDELADASPQTVIATGFLRVGPWDAERGASVQPSEVVAERFNELDDLVSTTAQVFLGLTLGCARCHDHKFDPLSSRDYYSMVAVFHPLVRPKNGRTELTRPAVPPSKHKEKNAADQQIADLRQRVRELQSPLLQAILESGETKLSADVIAAAKLSVNGRTTAQQQLLQRSDSQINAELAAAFGNSMLAGRYLSKSAVQEVEAAIERITDLQDRFAYPAGYFFHEPSPEPPVTHLLKRGNPEQPGEIVSPAVPLAVGQTMTSVQPEFEWPDGLTSRRRISLGRWIARDDNPLTSRVIVNRIWQFHFGVGLVRSPNDFGNRGIQPSHPALLDWLAYWFVHDADWSLKKLHLLIMTSSTYQMSKQPRPPNAGHDPDNRLLSHFPRRRLEVEAIRDSILQVSGQLNRQLYGPGMYPRIPEAALRSGYDPAKVWKPFDERDASRRTIYSYVKRSLVVPFLETLDFCDTTQSSARRDITTVAPQALELLNGEFVARQSMHFARRLRREAGSGLSDQIELACLLGLSRAPTPDEVTSLTEFVEQETKDLLTETGVSPENLTEEVVQTQALARMCRLVFNLNEFVYTD